jgi:hypothetical protein
LARQSLRPRDPIPSKPLINDVCETNETQGAIRLKSGSAINVLQLLDRYVSPPERKPMPDPGKMPNRRSIATNPSRLVRQAAVTILLAAAIAVLPGMGLRSVRAETVDTPVCRVHLDKVETTLTRAQSEFESSLAQGLEAECGAMHGQVRAMLAVRNIYRRCMEGPERNEIVALMDSSIGQTTDRIAARCAKRSADARID